MAAAPQDPKGDASAYERKKSDAAIRSARESDAGRDIGPIPKVRNKSRRAKAEKSLLFFLRTYFPDRFNLKFSDDQVEVVEETEKVIEVGGQEPIGMPRGSGKSQICTGGTEWAVITGRRDYVYLVLAVHLAAKRRMQTIKSDFLTNDLLLEDFPEVCYPIRAMDDRANRCRGQHCQGRKTWMTWSGDRIVLPAIAGSKAASAVLCVTSLWSSSLRGPEFTRPSDSRTVRPDLVILDDVQDDRIAANPLRVEKTLGIIKGTILGMAGPGKKMSVLAPCTIIQPDDVADQLLDPKRNPDWHGKIYKLLYSFPSDMKLWDEYAHLRAECLRADGTIKAATAFYKANRPAMDEGARVAWSERFNPDEASALQHAMNLYYRDQATFFAEFQNEPRTKDSAKAQLKRDDLLTSRFNEIERGTVPTWATHLVAFIDVQQTLLYWLAAAWADDFTGAIVDYGTWPDQERRYFTLAEAPRPFASVPELRGANIEGSIRFALGKLASALKDRAWVRQGGGAVQLDRILIDTGYKKDPIYEWVRSSEHRSILLPARGLPIGAKSKPLSEYFRKPGERMGFHWRIPLPQTTHGVKTLQIDANFWRSFVAERLRLAVGDRGALSFFGRPGTDHRLLADHLTAESFTPVTANGREIEEWDLRPSRPDNHWWDCLVGCAAGASHDGASLMGDTKPKQKKSKMSYDEWRRQKFGSQN